MYTLSIIVPCYNEAGNIPLIFARFREVLGDSKDATVLLVNNGSKDNSVAVFKEQLEKYRDSRFKVVEVPVNQGYGFGILSGLKEATGNVLAWTHADMQTDPKDVMTAFELFKQKNDADVFIKGKRKNRKIAEEFFTFGMQVVSSLALHTPLKDINAQPKMFSRKFYEDYVSRDAPWDFSLDLYVLYKAKKHSDLYEIPVYFNKRMHGEAKGGGSFKTRIKLIKRTFTYILNCEKK